MYPFTTQVFELKVNQLFKLNKNSRIYVCTENSEFGVRYRVAENLKSKESTFRKYHKSYNKKIEVVQFY